MTIGDRPIVAVSQSPAADFGRAVRDLSTHTLRRRIFKWGFRGLAWAGRVDRYFREVLSPLLGDDDGAVWSDITSRLRLIAAVNEYVVYYPAQPRRRRAYYRTHGSDRIFAKIEYGVSRGRLENENAALAQRARMRSEFPTFSVPEIIAFYSCDAYRMIVMRAVDDGLQPVAARWTDRIFRVRNEVLGEVRIQPLKSLEFWRQIQKISREICLSSFVTSLESVLDDKQAVGFAHGDFAPSNVLADKERILLLDWEAASEDAPFMLDEVTFRLSANQKAMVRDPVRVARSVCRDLKAECDKHLRKQRVDSFLLSLAYMVQAGNQEASTLAGALSPDAVESLYELP